MWLDAGKFERAFTVWSVKFKRRFPPFIILPTTGTGNNQPIKPLG